jgi:antitoxin HicB
MKYLMEVFWSEEGKGYIAAIPDLPGCSAWGRETPDEAIREVQKVAAVWLEA